jgi:hypothetical protein
VSVIPGEHGQRAVTAAPGNRREESGESLTGDADTAVPLWNHICG